MSGTSIDLIPFGDPRCGVRLTTEDARSLAQALLEATGDEPVFTNDEGRRVAWRLLKLCGGS
ncbi:hypothetical protein [Tamaricihabitans halophyticus]|nr:hypothetical protein [Tamaricihabitans halophyticus]